MKYFHFALYAMLMTAQSQPVVSEACERLFTIDEFVISFLHQAPTLVLVDCQGVCSLWNSIISGTPALQKRLFIMPSWTDLQEGQDEADDSNAASDSHQREDIEWYADETSSRHYVA